MGSGGVKNCAKWPTAPIVPASEREISFEPSWYGTLPERAGQAERGQACSAELQDQFSALAKKHGAGDR